MAGLVTTLQPGTPLAAATHLAGPWREFEVSTVQGGSHMPIDADNHEIAIFVTAGDGTVTIDGQEVPIAVGSYLMVGYGSKINIAAGSGLLTLFCTTLNVPA